MATSLSKVTKIRWRAEDIITIHRDESCNSKITSAWSTPNNRQVLHRIKDGCTRRPVRTSVAAKQASKMLVFVWSRGLLFTAIITSTLSRTVKGQEIPLVITVLIKLTRTGTFFVSLSVAISMTLAKFDSDKLISSPKRNGTDALQDVIFLS